ncbi:energy transducer TonB [Elioraea sp.]|uniref:energy transducer TonB n=1 Tax=Elioraea sp. TaxID=2185103 RepID=UPI00307D4D15
MSARLGLAVGLSAALHAAVAGLLAALPPAAPEEPPEQGVAIAVVFSAGGGGARIGKAADPAPPTPPAATEPAAEPAPGVAAGPAPPAPAEPPPIETAALPLPPPPPAAPAPPPRPALPAHAVLPVAPQAAASDAAARLDAAIPASVGRKVDPVVPREARLNRWQGTVVLAVTVSPEGVPALVEVLRSSGHSMLDRAAIEAMWQWRFAPARRGGVPVEERIAVPITFRIVD